MKMFDTVMCAVLLIVALAIFLYLNSSTYKNERARLEAEEQEDEPPGNYCGGHNIHYEYLGNHTYTIYFWDNHIEEHGEKFDPKFFAEFLEKPKDGKGWGSGTLTHYRGRWWSYTVTLENSVQQLLLSNKEVYSLVFLDGRVTLKLESGGGGIVPIPIPVPLGG